MVMREDSSISQGRVDVIIVGGGHAGLSAAQTLYRARHTVVILDSDRPRHHMSKATRLVSGWEGQDPKALRAAAALELESTGLVQIVRREAVSARKVDNGFEIVDSLGKAWTGSKILLATGVEEILLDIPGYKDIYGVRIYHCLFCFGYEDRDSRSAGILAIGILSNPRLALITALDALKFVGQVTIYTNSNNETFRRFQQDIQKHNYISLENRRIVHLSSKGMPEGAVQLELEDSTVLQEAFLVHKPHMTLDRNISTQLGVEIKSGSIDETFTNSPPFNETNVSGVFAAGDCATPMRNIPMSMASGSFAACGIARQLGRNVAM